MTRWLLLLSLLCVAYSAKKFKIVMSCNNKIKPTCVCPNQTTTTGLFRCADNSFPSCTCTDGTPAAVIPHCKNKRFPECKGACTDKSDYKFQKNKIGKCKDGSVKFDWKKCKCKDGTKLDKYIVNI